MNDLQLDSLVQLFSWICFTSVLLGHLAYDVLCYFAVFLIRCLIRRVRVAQCKIR